MNAIVKLVGSKVRDAMIMPRLRNLMGMAEQQLQKTEFLAGSNLTAADITAVYPFSSVFTRYPEMALSYPHCKAWLDHLFERPAFKAAQEWVGEKHGIVFEDE
jgi:glutathione S-transferase